MGFSSLLFFALSCVLGRFGFIFPPKDRHWSGLPSGGLLLRADADTFDHYSVKVSGSSGRACYVQTHVSFCCSLFVSTFKPRTCAKGGQLAYIQGTFFHPLKWHRRNGDIKWCFCFFRRFNLSLLVLRAAACFERCLVISGVFKGAGISQISGIVRKNKGIHHPQDTRLLDKTRLRERNQQIHPWKMGLRQQDAVLTSLHWTQLIFPP